MKTRTVCSLLCLMVVALVFSGTASAHRIDEYLQAARISVDPDRVHVEIDLTAGIDVADKVLAMIDNDHDGKISTIEGSRYAQRVLDSMTLKVDDQRQTLTLIESRFPSPADMSIGEGMIRLQAAASIPSASVGDHKLAFANTHRPDIGVYLINALVPTGEQIHITGQRRDTFQHEFEMNYNVTAAATVWTWASIWWITATLGLGGLIWKEVLLRRDRQRRNATRGIVLGFICGMLSASPSQAQKIPNAIDDREFWRMITEMSEPEASFPRQYMSNEDSAQFVIPALQQRTRPGGVYVGVGLEQNFTYIAALQPKLAFIVDIRRDNMIEHLMYKALFEISTDRADFLSRLLSRKRPARLDTNSSAKTLFDAYQTVEADAAIYDDNLHAVIDRLTYGHELPLSETDKTDIARILNAFRTTGPYTLRGQGDATNPTYAQLMTATDLTGRNQSYLASEQTFKVVRDLEKQNLIVPLVGNFAGSTALVNVGKYLRKHGAIVNIFYVSNVERYLFEQGDDEKKFYANVAALPLDSTSTFIRSVTSDISVRLGIPIPESTAKWRSFLAPITDSLKAYASGRIQNYRDIFN